MGDGWEMIVSNSGPLIHLTRIGKLKLLKKLFGEVIIPIEARIEVVDRGKEEGIGDAFLIEREIEDGWIITEKNSSNKVSDIAESAGIDIGEASAIMLAGRKKCPVLIDDLAARRFAAGLGFEVVGSIGVLIRCAKVKTISKSEALEALEKLGRVMWLGIDVYEDAQKIIGELL